MKRRSYKYENEVFKLVAEEYYIEVWLDNEVRYVGAALNCTNENPYGVSTRLTDGRLGWTPFNGNRTLTEAIDNACWQLLRSRQEKALDIETISKRMSEEFERLPS